MFLQPNAAGCSPLCSSANQLTASLLLQQPITAGLLFIALTQRPIRLCFFFWRKKIKSTKTNCGAPRADGKSGILWKSGRRLLTCSSELPTTRLHGRWKKKTLAADTLARPTGGALPRATWCRLLNPKCDETPSPSLRVVSSQLLRRFLRFCLRVVN